MKAIVVLSAKGKSTTEKIVSEAGKTLNLLKSSEVHRLAYLFRNAHAIAKQNEFLMEMRNMWWRFRFLFGQTIFFSVRQFF